MQASLPSEHAKPYVWHHGFSVKAGNDSTLQSHVSYRGATPINIALFTFPDGTWKYEVIYNPPVAAVTGYYGYVGDRLDVAIVVAPVQQQPMA